MDNEIGRRGRYSALDTVIASPRRRCHLAMLETGCADVLPERLCVLYALCALYTLSSPSAMINLFNATSRIPWPIPIL